MLCNVYILWVIFRAPLNIFNVSYEAGYILMNKPLPHFVSIFHCTAIDASEGSNISPLLILLCFPQHMADIHNIHKSWYFHLQHGNFYQKAND